MTSTIVTDVNNFIADQDTNRGQAVDGGGTLATYYNALTSTAVTGENAVTGIAGIASGASAITLPSSQPGNAVIVDGAISTTASTSGTDSYSLLVASSGTETLTDNNTGYSETITGAAYFVFDGGAKASSGAYQSTVLVETGVYAQVASMYNAAFGRVPDFAGLEYNAIPVAKGVLSLHDLAVDFLASPEFANLYLGGSGSAATIGPADNGGPNDVQFIDKLYGQILHRAPDAAEVNYYVEALQGTLVVNGVDIPASDRADLLIYFSMSPENQADISASSGGWLINPANGALSIGAMSSTTASSVLTSEAASGTIDTMAFANMSSTGQTTIQVDGQSVTITGTNYYGSQGTDPGVTIDAPNLTVNLTSEYYFANISAPHTTINGVASGGSVVTITNTAPIVTPIGTVPALAGSGTVNLAGSDNWIEIYGTTTVAVTTVVNGWNSSNVFSGTGTATPSTASTFATLVAEANGVVYQGNASSPISGATLGGQNSGTWFTTHQVAINVGNIANDSVATMVSAANAVYKVGDIGTVNQQTSETVFFYGQDPQGNTIVDYWHGDSTHAGTVLAADITGSVDLVGVQASSLTNSNFHL